MDSLVSTEWLAQHLGECDLVPVDASLHMSASGRNAREEYQQAHIPGARFLDIEELSDHAHPAPHMLPSADTFAHAMQRLGIGSSDRIVVYDNSPLRTAARGWFMLRHFGAENVAILDGGLGKWIAEGNAVESGEPPSHQARFVPQERNEVVTKEQVLAGIDCPLLDARSAARFDGVEKDPRRGIANGHIPGAHNLPFALLYSEDETFKPAEELKRLFAAAGIDPRKPFVASCGSGITANSLIFGAHLLGNDKVLLYDGSWSEWGADPSTPKAIGSA